MRRLGVLLATLALLSIAACGGAGDETAASGSDPTTASPQSHPPSPPTGTAPVSATPHVIDTIASGLAVPWGIAFLPDGSALVTERDSGRVLHIVGRTITSVGTIDQTRAQGESGLLGIAVSPSYAQDSRVFVYTTTDSDNRILRMSLRNDQLGTPTTILAGIPHGFVHDGGRLVFGPDGSLYASTGEAGHSELAQDRTSLGGKILRIDQNGRPAPGNPDPASPVWTIGHRNVQGLAFDGQGRLWASEFGENTWDELNLITKGSNYGWPVVEGRSARDEFRNPAVVWRTSEASPSGLAFADGQLWLGALRGERLWRITVTRSGATEPADFFVGKYGRMRTVVTAPDGDLWVTTSNRDGRGDPVARDDRILLVRPQA